MKYSLLYILLLCFCIVEVNAQTAQTETPYYVVEAKNAFKVVGEGCKSSDRPIWGKCEYNWYTKSPILSEDKVTSKDKINYHQFSESELRVGVYFSEKIMPENFRHETETSDEVVIKLSNTPDAIVTTDWEKCSWFHAERYEVTTTFQIDGPIKLNKYSYYDIVEGPKQGGVAFIFEDSSLTITIEDEFHASRDYVLEYSVDDRKNYLEAKSFTSKLIFSKEDGKYKIDDNKEVEVSISYKELCNLLKGSFKYEFGNPIYFRVKKNMIDGTAQYTDYVQVIIAKRIPEFTVEEVYAPSCKLPFEYVIIKVDEKDAQFLNEKYQCSWKVNIVGDEGDYNLLAAPLGNGKFKLTLDLDNVNDFYSNLVNVKFPVETKITLGGKIAEEKDKKSKVAGTSEYILYGYSNEEGTLKGEKEFSYRVLAPVKMERNLTIRRKNGGYDFFGQIDNPYVIMDIKDNELESRSKKNPDNANIYSYRIKEEGILKNISNIDGSKEGAKYEDAKVSYISELRERVENAIAKGNFNNADCKRWEDYYRCRYFDSYFNSKCLIKSSTGTVESDYNATSKIDKLVGNVLMAYNVDDGYVYLLKWKDKFEEGSIYRLKANIDIVSDWYNRIEKVNGNVKSGEGNIVLVSPGCYEWDGPNSENIRFDNDGKKFVTNNGKSLQYEDDKFGHLFGYPTTEWTVSSTSGRFWLITSHENSSPTSYVAGLDMSSFTLIFPDGSIDGIIESAEMYGGGSSIAIAYRDVYGGAVIDCYRKEWAGDRYVIKQLDGAEFKTNNNGSVDIKGFKNMMYGLYSKVVFSLDGKKYEYDFTSSYNRNFESDRTRILREMFKNSLTDNEELFDQFLESEFEIYWASNRSFQMFVPSVNKLYTLEAKDSDGCPVVVDGKESNEENEKNLVRATQYSLSSLFIFYGTVDPTGKCSSDGSFNIYLNPSNPINQERELHIYVDYDGTADSKNLLDFEYESKSLVTKVGLNSVIYFKVTSNSGIFYSSFCCETNVFKKEYSEPSVITDVIFPDVNNEGTGRVSFTCNDSGVSTYSLVSISDPSNSTETSDSKTLSNLSWGEYATKVTYNGCPIEVGTVYIPQVEASFDGVVVTDASEIGKSDGKATLGAKVSSGYTYRIKASNQTSDNKDLVLSGMAAGNYDAKLYLTNSSNELFVADKSFKVNQPGINLVISSTIDNDNWTVTVANMQDSNLSIKNSKGGDLQFGSIIDKTITECVLYYYGKELARISRPEKSIRYTASGFTHTGAKKSYICSGDEVGCTITSDDIDILNYVRANSTNNANEYVRINKIDGKYNIVTNASDFALEAKNIGEKEVESKLVSSTVSLVEIVVEKISLKVPVVAPISLTQYSLADRLSCEEEDLNTKILNIKEKIGGGNPAWKYFVTVYYAESKEDLKIDDTCLYGYMTDGTGNKTDVSSISDPSAYYSSRSGYYKFVINSEKSECPNDALVLDQYTAEPMPIEIKTTIEEPSCNEPGQVIISSVKGGNLVERIDDYYFVFGSTDKKSGNELSEFEKAIAELTNLDDDVPDIYRADHSAGNVKVYSTPKGNYSLAVYDGSGCSRTYVQGENGQLVLSNRVDLHLNGYDTPKVEEVTADPITCNGAQDGVLNIKISRPNNDDCYVKLSYKANEKGVYVDLPEKQVTADNMVIGDLNAGYYKVSIVDSNDCESNEITDIAIHEPSPLIFAPIEGSFDKYITEYNGIGGSVSFYVSGAYTDGSYTIIVDGKTEKPVSDGTITLSGFAKGSHTFQCLNKKGDTVCSSDILTLTFEQPEKQLAISTTVNHPKCNGNNGSIVVVADGGWGAPYTYNVVERPDVDYDKEKTCFILPAGTYTIEVIDAKGGIISEKVTLIQPENISVKLSQESPVCDGAGMVRVSISGGTVSENQSYQTILTTIDNKQVGEALYGNEVTFKQVPIGEYIFNTTDENGCSQPEQMRYTVSDESLKIEIVDKVYPSMSDYTLGSIKVSVKGGNESEYTYRWTDFATQKVISTSTEATDLGGGTYLFEVTDNNCSASEVISLVSVETMTLRLTRLQRETALDANDGKACLSSEFAIGDRKVVVYLDGESVNNPIVSKDGNTMCLTGLEPGNYRVECYDATIGSVESALFTIPKYEAMNLYATELRHQSKKDAIDGRVAYTLIGGVGPYNVMVNDKPITFDGKSFTLSNLAAGSYSIVVTDSCNNTINTDFSIFVPEKELTLSAKVLNVKCFGEKNGVIQLTADGGWYNYRYRLDGAEVGGDTYFSNLAAGTYSFDVIDLYGNTRHLDVTIEQPDKLKLVSVEVDDIHCYGDRNGAVHLNVVGGTGSYQIKKQNQSGWVEGTTYDMLAAGNHVFIVKDDLGCSLDNIKIEIQAPTQLVVKDTKIMQSTCNIDNGAVELDVDGGTGLYKYQWKENGEIMNIDQSSANNLKQGAHYTIVVTDENNCRVETYADIKKSIKPEIKQVGVVPVSCYGLADGYATINLMDVVTSSIKTQYKLIWENGEEGSRSPLQAAGVYKVIIRDENGCESETTYEIPSPSKVDVQLTVKRDAQCYGDNNGVLRVEGVGGKGGYSYRWSNGSHNAYLDQLYAGKYTVVVTDINMCAAEATYTTEEPELMTVFAGEDVTICPGNTYRFSCDEYATYEWKNSYGQVLSNTNTFDASKDGTYTLVVTDERGCKAEDDVALIVGNDALEADFLIPSTAFVQDTIMAVELSNMPLDEFHWEYPEDAFDLLTDSQDASYTLRIQPNTIGTFEVTLEATAGGCTSVLRKSIIILGREESEDDDINLGYDPIIKSFVVSPSPTTGLISAKIELREEYQAHVKIFNLSSGQMLTMKSVNDNSRYDVQFNLSAESKGLYLVTLDVEGEHRSVKIIVK